LEDFTSCPPSALSSRKRLWHTDKLLIVGLAIPEKVSEENLFPPFFQASNLVGSPFRKRQGCAHPIFSCQLIFSITERKPSTMIDGFLEFHFSDLFQNTALVVR